MATEGERKKRLPVAGSTCSHVLDKATKSLGLPDLPYKLYVDSKGDLEGSLIDDDELLNELAAFYSNSGKHLSVILLQSNEEWRSSENNGATSSDIVLNRTISESSDSSGYGTCASPSSLLEVNMDIPATPPRTPSRTYPAIASAPFEDIFGPVLEHMKKDPPPKNLPLVKRSAIREAQKLVASHIVKKVKDFRRGVCEQYATTVFNSSNGKFHCIFSRYVNGIFCSDGLQDFINHIYNAVNYSKGTENTVKRGHRRSRRSDEEIDNPDCPDTPQKQARRITEDSYGCENFNPPLPANETCESQELKRLALLQSDDLNSGYVVCLFQKTYPTQRSEIINCSSLKKLIDVFERWPCLKSSELLIHHASLLFKKDVQLLWSEQLDKMSLDIVKYFTTYCERESMRQDSRPKNLVTKLLNILSSKDQAIENTRSQLPNTISVFPLLIAYMREETNFFYQLVQTDTPDAVEKAAEPANGNPILVVQGHSLFDLNAKFFVVLLNNQIIKASSCLEGILLLFLSFFIFGFKYTEGIQNSLEFIQRFLFLINPPTGDKRMKKRSTGVVPGRVFKLSEDIRAFTSPWTIPNPNPDE